MTKLLAILTIGLISMTAQAGSFIVEYSPTQGIGRPDATAYLVKVGESISKNVELDFQMVTAQTDGTNALSTRLETGLTPRWEVGPGRFYTKFALGKKLDVRGNKEY